MRFRYTQWQGGWEDNAEFRRALLNLYHHLLLQSNGDVDEALENLERIGEYYGFFDENFTIEDFKKWLKKLWVKRTVP